MSKLTSVSIFLAACLLSVVVSTNVLFAQSDSAAINKYESTLGSVGNPIFNPIKFAIHGAITSGVPANTIVLLLLLPLVAAVIAATRHLIGIRGFGIFLPAALSVVFVATGPLVGLGLFVLIALVSVVVRLILRKLKLKLQYLPRMALLLWAVSLSVLLVLFAAPLVKYTDIANVSIFPVLLLALLAEDFTRVQLGKSFKTALNLTSETLVLALVSYLVLTFEPIQKFALLNPEVLLMAVFVFDLVIGKYVGLRLREVWRFRKLINT
ncbi:MAG: 7TM domain-containing protein [Patescibacteria group bacterium]